MSEVLDLDDGRRVLRVPFGHETAACATGGPTCPHCETRRGHQHVDGCLVEQCPSCSAPRALCDCSTTVALRTIDLVERPLTRGLDPEYGA